MPSLSTARKLKLELRQAGQKLTAFCSSSEQALVRKAWLFALAFAFLSVWSFQLSRQVMLFCFFPLLLLLKRSFMRQLAAHEAQLEEQEFVHFLNYLAAQLNVGKNVSLALAEAYRQLAPELSPQGRLIKGLTTLSVSLYSGLNLEQALQDFAQNFKQASILNFCRILAKLLRWGGRYDIYVNLCRDNLRKSLELRSEIRSAQSASLSEAFIMSILPFVLAYVMTRSQYYSAVEAGAVLKLCFTLLWLAAQVIFLLCLKILRESLDSPALPQLNIRKASAGFQEDLAQWLAQLYEQVLPDSWLLKLKQILGYLQPQRSTIWHDYCLSKTCRSLAGLIPGLLLCDLFPALALFLGLLLYQDARILGYREQMTVAERAEYPEFLNLLAILLDSGLSTERSLNLTLLALREEEPRNLLTFDLEGVSQDLQSGLAPEEALYHLAQSRFQVEIAQCLYTTHRYAREGSAEQLESLKLQARQSYDKYRNSMRGSLSKKSLKLLLPMALDLILVLAIAALPAILQIQI